MSSANSLNKFEKLSFEKSKPPEPQHELHQITKFNPFPNGKILDLSKFKAFAEDKIDVSKKMIFVLGRVENIVGNGENAGYRHFLHFPERFQKPISPEP